MKLNYKTLGEGDPLIILHGLFGMLDNWQSISKKFAEHYQVYLIDQRNHGKSPHEDLIDYPSMAEDLYDFMFDHDIDQANILGHSMGGKTVMHFAHLYPEKVRRLIIVDIAPRAYKGSHHDIFEALYNVDLNLVETRTDAEQMIGQRIGEVEVRSFLLKNLKRKKEGGFEWKMNLHAIYRHYQDILIPLEAEIPFVSPSLFIRGERSNYILEEDFSLIKDQFPEAEIITIDEAGHWVHADAPEELFNVVHNFLQK